MKFLGKTMIRIMDKRYLVVDSLQWKLLYSYEVDNDLFYNLKLLHQYRLSALSFLFDNKRRNKKGIKSQVANEKKRKKIKHLTGQPSND